MSKEDFGTGSLVAVYGTLRKEGGGNHRLLKNADYKGHCELNGFEMVSLGGFPAISKGGKNQKIKCEVYEIESEDTAQSLDWLEGYPSFYDRMKVGTPHGEAWIYFFNEKEEGAEVIESGDWVKYIGIEQ